MRLHRTFRDTDLNCVGHELSIFHRHGVDDDSVSVCRKTFATYDQQLATYATLRCGLHRSAICRSPGAAGAPFLLNFVSEEIITSTVAFVFVSTVTDSSDTLITVPITCCSFP